MSSFKGNNLDYTITIFRSTDKLKSRHKFSSHFSKAISIKSFLEEVPLYANEIITQEYIPVGCVPHLLQWPSRGCMPRGVSA